MLGQALNNIGDAKSVLGVAEGGLMNINDILLTMKEKSLQAASDTLGRPKETRSKNSSMSCRLKSTTSWQKPPLTVWI